MITKVIDALLLEKPHTDTRTWRVSSVKVIDTQKPHTDTRTWRVSSVKVINTRCSDLDN